MLYNTFNFAPGMQARRTVSCELFADLEGCCIKYLLQKEILHLSGKALTHHGGDVILHPLVLCIHYARGNHPSSRQAALRLFGAYTVLRRLLQVSKESRNSILRKVQRQLNLQKNCRLQESLREYRYQHKIVKSAENHLPLVNLRCFVYSGSTSCLETVSSFSKVETKLERYLGRTIFQCKLS